MAKVLYRKVAKLALRFRKRFLSSPLPFLGCHTHLRTRSLRMPLPLVRLDEDPSLTLLPPLSPPEDKPQCQGPFASEKRDGRVAPTAVVSEKAEKDKTAASEIVLEKEKMAGQVKKDKNAAVEVMPEQVIKKDYCDKAAEEEGDERESAKEDHNSNDNGKERERQTSEKERDKEKEKEDEDETAMMKMMMTTTESTYSYDPCADFRQSMVEMLTSLRKRNGDAANGMIHGSELHNLCRAYLLVNPVENHGFIEMAFQGLLLDLYFGLV